MTDPRAETPTAKTTTDEPIAWSTNEAGDVVCQHGTAADVHCCNCHSGFLFDADSCVCEFEECANG